MKNIIKLSPFKHLIMTVGNLPSSYVDSLSYYECLMWLCKYLKETVIPAIDNNAEAVQELQTKYVELKNYIDTYFENLDVQEEINNKLDEMVTDGTFDTIINQELFGELNQKIEDYKIDPPNFFLSSFFERNAPFGIKLFTSLDDVNYTELNIPENLTGRDPSIQYNKITKKFYICLTRNDNVSNFRILSSSDLITWEENNYYVGIDPNITIWAPDLYIDDDGHFYVIMSVQYGTETDIAGNSIPAFDQYIATSSDGETFNTAYKLTLTSDTRNYIDGSLIKINGIYYLITKNEYYKRNEIFTTNDLLTFTLVNNNITNSSLWVEGGCLLQTENYIYYLADAYMNQKYIVGKTKKSNFPNFTNFTMVDSLDDFAHGNSIYVTDFNAKKVITDLGTCSFTNNNILYKKAELKDTQYISRITDDNKNNLCVDPNYIYSIIGSDEVSVKIVNLFKTNTMKFMFLAASNAKLKITHIDGQELRKPIIISNNATINEKILEIPILKSSYELYTDFKTETISASDITDINEAIQVTGLTGKKCGNIVTLNFTMKILNTGYENGVWVSSLFKLPAKWRTGLFLVVPNDKGLNLQMYDSGVIGGVVKGNQNSTIIGTVVYFAEK